MKHCPKCNTSCSDALVYCYRCSTKLEPVEQIDNNSGRTSRRSNQTGKRKRKVKTKIVLLICLTAFLFSYFYQLYLASNIDVLYRNGLYIDAYEQFEKLMIPSVYTGDSIKLSIFRQIQQKESFANSFYNTRPNVYESGMRDSLILCIANSIIAEDHGFSYDLSNYRRAIVAKLVYDGIDPVKFIMKDYIFSDEYTFYPLLKSIDGDYIKSRIQSLSEDYKQEDLQKAINRKNPIIIEDTKFTYSSNNYWTLKGTVSNVSEKPCSYVKIRIEYLDKNKDTLTYDENYLLTSDSLRPGDKKQFEVKNKVDGDVKHCQYSIVDFSVDY